MAIEELSAGSSGVARYAQRPAKAALISNTDNSAVQQYAQVSLFTSYLTDAPQPVAQNDAPPDRQPEQSFASSYDGYSSSYSTASSDSSSTEPPVSILNYSAKGAANLTQNANQTGKLISLSV